MSVPEGEREGWSAEEVRVAVARVREARPTAVNLMVCVDRVMTCVWEVSAGELPGERLRQGRHARPPYEEAAPATSTGAASPRMAGSGVLSAG